MSSVSPQGRTYRLGQVDQYNYTSSKSNIIKSILESIELLYISSIGIALLPFRQKLTLLVFDNFIVIGRTGSNNKYNEVDKAAILQID